MALGAKDWPPGDGVMAGLIRARDWGATPLGPLKTWPSSLRHAVQLILGSPVPMILHWGPTQIALYNDAAIPQFGSHHPRALGTPGGEIFPEAWVRGVHLYQSVLAGGGTIEHREQEYWLERKGRLEPAWFSYAISPVLGDDGSIAGVLTVNFEVTEEKHAKDTLRQEENRQGFLVRLMDALRPLQDAETIMSTATGLLGSRLSCDRAYYAEVEPNDAFIYVPRKYFSSGSVRSIAGRLRLDDLSAWAVGEARAGRTIVATDTQRVEGDTPEQRALYQQTQIGAFICAPLVKDGRLAAILMVTQAAPRQWSEAERICVEETAERTWAAVGRARAEQALRDREARQTLMLGLSDRLRSVDDPDAVAQEACRTIGQYLGVNRCQYGEGDGQSFQMRPGYLNGVPPMRAQRGPVRMFGQIAQALSLRGQDFVVSNVETDERFNDVERDTYRSNEIAACVSIKIQKGGQTVATLAAHHRVPRAWNPNELQLLREAADRLMAEVERARAQRELRGSEERFRQMALRAEAANRTKDEFLSTLSHDLRTPLSPILLWSKVLLSGGVPLAEAIHALQVILQSAQSQSRLIEDLLDLSRLRSGRLSLALQRTAPADVLRSAAEMLRPEAEAKRIFMMLDIEERLGHCLLDPNRMRQVFWNLLSNAVKFTPAGGSVTLRLRRTAESLVATVTDTGQGISPEFIPHLFERFRQEDATTSRSHGGLGIGLALCRYLVELHGGSIEAHSDGPGTGTSFTVRVPWEWTAQAPGASA